MSYDVGGVWWKRPTLQTEERLGEDRDWRSVVRGPLRGRPVSEEMRVEGSGESHSPVVLTHSKDWGKSVGTRSVGGLVENGSDVNPGGRGWVGL